MFLRTPFFGTVDTSLFTCFQVRFQNQKWHLDHLKILTRMYIKGEAVVCLNFQTTGAVCAHKEKMQSMIESDAATLKLEKGLDRA
jgi:hypothetical protein